MTIEWKSNLNEHLASQPNFQTMTEKLILSFSKILIGIAEDQFKHLYTYLLIQCVCFVCTCVCTCTQTYTHIMAFESWFSIAMWFQEIKL